MGKMKQFRPWCIALHYARTLKLHYAYVHIDWLVRNVANIQAFALNSDKMVDVSQHSTSVRDPYIVSSRSNSVCRIPFTFVFQRQVTHNSIYPCISETSKVRKISVAI